MQTNPIFSFLGRSLLTVNINLLQEKMNEMGISSLKELFLLLKKIGAF